MIADAGDMQTWVLSGRYADALSSEVGPQVIDAFVCSLLPAKDPGRAGDDSASQDPAANLTRSVATVATSHDTLLLATAALHAFLQVNVTGPILDGASRIERLFAHAAASASADDGAASTLQTLRRACFRSLDVDGVAVYPYISHVELFCLARFLVLTSLASLPRDADSLALPTELRLGCRAKCATWWMALRVRVWHHKLLSQPSAGPGSVGFFTRSAQWTEVPSLQLAIEQDLQAVEGLLFDRSSVDDAQALDDRIRFLVEKANVCVVLGHEARARDALKRAAGLGGFVYALSGALGKRTKFQEKSTSQLVVLAKSGAEPGGEDQSTDGQVKPQALDLNDDTLLESLDFSPQHDDDAERERAELDAPPPEPLPPALAAMAPDEQPGLSPLDQIILLTEATLRDAFSPADALTSEEILPFAVRVISDKSTNWQIYTQALLVRSRIELHRSRTLERGVLQMQAVVDQVIADTTSGEDGGGNGRRGGEEDDGSTPKTPAPMIQITSHGDGDGAAPKIGTDRQAPQATSIFPAIKPSESAPAQVRLAYIHALNSPPRWHLESELAYAWAGVGSLVSALEIFKRLRLWAEVALCYASRAATDDEDGRGSGGEAKAKAILRWQLYHKTNVSVSGTDHLREEDKNDRDLDVSGLREDEWRGPERMPPPPNAPRLLCILGDIEQEPAHYERAWAISEHRYARAQKSLGEYYLQHKDRIRAREAYRKATSVNRLSPELWSRLGDIGLSVGDFAEAAEAFGRAIGAANDAVGGEDARTWSNLGSALYSLSLERQHEIQAAKTGAAEEKDATEAEEKDTAEPDDIGSDSAISLSSSGPRQQASKRDPSVLLVQALAAYKRGASMAHDNWRIWDNVITLGSRLRPPAVSDMLVALRQVIRIRNDEDVLDIDVLRILLNEVLLSNPAPGSGIYEPPRGSQERAVCELVETTVVPLITARSDLWELIVRVRIWRRDYAGAIDAAERAWRAAVGTGGAGGTLAAPSSSSSSSSTSSSSSLHPGGGDAAGDHCKKKSRNWVEDKEAWRDVVERTDDLVGLLASYGEDMPSIGGRWKGKARSAIRSVMGKGKDSWEGSGEWTRLEGLLEGLR